jgi:uncharacterized RDD family membrane protein YckC
MTNQGSAPPGWYSAPGDPPGTHRYWDGAQWTTGPQPIGPAQPLPSMAPAGAYGLQERGPNYAPNSNRPLAEPGQRIVARLIDFAISFVAGGLIAAAIISGSAGAIGLLLIVGVLGILYEVAFTALKGGTPGKLIMGIGVQTESGELPPGWTPAIMRWILTAIPFVSTIVFIVSLIFLFSDAQHRTVPDRVARTFVVKTK